MNRLLLDLTHTCHTRAHTGIQRVCRSLHTALAARADGVLAVCFDPHECTWRALHGWERRHLVPSAKAMASSRGARWPLPARLQGYARRWLRRHDPPSEIRIPSPGSGLIVPELFSTRVARALPALLAHVAGPRIALFHDAIALKLPEFTPAETVARSPAYLQELLSFDGLAVMSEDSRQTLTDFWRWLGIGDPPPVAVVPLGIDAPVPSPYGQISVPDAPPVVLSVGSIEGRKNHLALLEACASLWQRGLRFELRLIGLAHPQTGGAALARLRALRTAGRPLHHEGPVSEPDLQAAYRTCAFTIYPSLMEGFGLPVLESLSYGKPCICSARGALGEAAIGGGCLTLERVDAPALARAIERLLTDPEQALRLAEAAHARTFKPWPAYADELVSWMRSLPRRG
jgi:glycosyltransferase involved in cell wall biosynthesis